MSFKKFKIAVVMGGFFVTGSLAFAMGPFDSMADVEMSDVGEVPASGDAVFVPEGEGEAEAADAQEVARIVPPDDQQTPEGSDWPGLWCSVFNSMLESRPPTGNPGEDLWRNFYEEYLETECTGFEW